MRTCYLKSFPVNAALFKELFTTITTIGFVSKTFSSHYILLLILWQKLVFTCLFICVLRHMQTILQKVQKLYHKQIFAHFFEKYIFLFSFFCFTIHMTNLTGK